jgi:hypothetical protein
MPDYQEICDFFYKVRNNLLEDEADNEQASNNNFTEEFQQGNSQNDATPEYGFSEY